MLTPFRLTSLLTTALLLIASTATAQGDDLVAREREEAMRRQAERQLRCAAEKAAGKVAVSLLEAAAGAVIIDGLAGESESSARLEEASAASGILGVNLLKAGIARAAETAAHHIVASNDVRAAEARALLRAAGITDLNFAENGVFLPQHGKSPNPNCAAVHAHIHTDAYYREVNARLAKAAPHTYKDVLTRIGRELLDNTFPY